VTDIHHVGEAYAWIEQDSSIHLKAASQDGDPVEMTAEEARELGRVLLGLADRLTQLDALDR